MKEADLSHLNVVTAGDLEQALRDGYDAVRVREGAMLTPSARDLASAGRPAVTSTLSAGGGTAAAPARASLPSDPEGILASPEALRIKQEIMHVGKKLWQRQYVDGNGGNISCRIAADYAIATPTLCSKADLAVEDFSLVDLEGRQVAGQRPRSSEILLHVEIYKAVPEARAVVHCHPPHATAYAIAGVVPPNCIIPEHEVFVGAVALSPYETPGTKKFAETVLPFVRKHNTILLANHGIVCWADSVTHAEWYAEVVDTYCRTLIIASHLGVPLTRIPGEKAADLLEIKKRLGLPDARFGMQECQLCDIPEFPGGIAACPSSDPAANPAESATGDDLEALIRMITDRVLDRLERDGK